jgi:hypothetical protein
MLPIFASPQHQTVGPGSLFFTVKCRSPPIFGLPFSMKPQTKSQPIQMQRPTTAPCCNSGYSEPPAAERSDTLHLFTKRQPGRWTLPWLVNQWFYRMRIVLTRSIPCMHTRRAGVARRFIFRVEVIRFYERIMVLSTFNLKVKTEAEGFRIWLYSGRHIDAALGQFKITVNWEREQSFTQHRML